MSELILKALQRVASRVLGRLGETVTVEQPSTAWDAEEGSAGDDVAPAVEFTAKAAIAERRSAPWQDGARTLTTSAEGVIVVASSRTISPGDVLKTEGGKRFRVRSRTRVGSTGTQIVFTVALDGVGG